MLALVRRAQKPAVVKAAASALWVLSLNEDNQAALTELGALDAFVTHVRCSKDVDVLHACAGILRILTMAAGVCSENRLAVSELGGIESLIKLCR